MGVEVFHCCLALGDGPSAWCEVVGQVTSSGSVSPQIFLFFRFFPTFLPWDCSKAEISKLSLECYSALAVPGGWGQHRQAPQQPQSSALLPGTLEA